MISIQQAREKLGNTAKEMSDKQIEDILNFLYKICNVIIDKELANHKLSLDENSNNNLVN